MPTNSQTQDQQLAIWTGRLLAQLYNW